MALMTRKLRIILPFALRQWPLLLLIIALTILTSAVTALQLPEAYYDQVIDDYSLRRDIFLAGLDAAGLRYTRPQGAYYVMVDVSGFGVTDDVDFCRWMAREVGVAGSFLELTDLG